MHHSVRSSVASFPIVVMSTSAQDAPCSLLVSYESPVQLQLTKESDFMHQLEQKDEEIKVRAPFNHMQRQAACNHSTAAASAAVAVPAAAHLPMCLLLHPRCCMCVDRGAEAAGSQCV